MNKTDATTAEPAFTAGDTVRHRTNKKWLLNVLCVSGRYFWAMSDTSDMPCTWYVAHFDRA
jgi:hypothetical protein